MPWLTTEGSPLVPLAFLVGFVALSLAVGRRLLLLLGASREGSPAERGVVALGLGAGALQFVPFALGVAGVLSTRAIAIAIAVIAIASAWDLRAVAAAAARSARSLRDAPAWDKAWAAALLPALVVATLMALAPTVDPDGMAYHLTVPKRWLHDGRLEYLPTYPYSNAPMGVEMLFAIGLALGGDAAAKCVHLALGVTGVVGLYLAGKRLHGPVAGAVAATLFLVGPFGTAPLLGTAYVEGAAALAMISGSLAWILWLRSRAPGDLRCAALLAGVAVTFKIPSVLFPVGLVALTCVAAMDPAGSREGWGARAKSALASIALPLALVVVPILPWTIRAAVLTGNPVYPLFASKIPSRDLSPDLAAKLDLHNRLMTWGNAFGRSWSLDQRKSILLVACAAVALVGALVFFRMRTWMTRGTTAVVTIIALAQLAAAGLYIRYAIPLAAVLAIPIVAALGPLLSRKPIPAAWIGVTLLASLFQARRAVAQEGTGAKELVETALGVEDRLTFLQRNLVLYPLYDDVNRDLPASAGVLLSCYCSGFYIDRATYCGEMVQTSLRYTSWEDFTSDLRRLGIRYVIAPIALATGGPDPVVGLDNSSTITRANQVRRVRELLVGHAHVRATAADQGLYEIDPALVQAP